MWVDGHRCRRCPCRRQSQRESTDVNLEHCLFSSTDWLTNTKIRLLTPIAFGFYCPYPNALALFASEGRLPGSQAETDPQVQQKSDITAHMGDWCGRVLARVG